MIKKCEKCNKEFNISNSRILADRGHFCSKKCHYLAAKKRSPWNKGIKSEILSESKKGDKNPMWTGGVSKKESDKKYSQTESGRRSHRAAGIRYNKRNRNKINKRTRERLKEEPHFKIKRNISNAIWCKLNRNRGCKKDNKNLRMSTLYN